jgi:hypothetical protein
VAGYKVRMDGFRVVDRTWWFDDCYEVLLPEVDST